jgi:hypothetical protein
MDSDRILSLLSVHAEEAEDTARLLRAAVEEITTLHEALEAAHAETDGARQRDLDESWRRLAPGLYLFRGDGFERVSPETAWTPAQLSAWLALAPTTRAAADAVVGIQDTPVSAAEIVRVAFAAAVKS